MYPWSGAAPWPPPKAHPPPTASRDDTAPRSFPPARAARWRAARRASQWAASRYLRGGIGLAGAMAWGVLILGLEGRAEMVRGPRPRQLDEQANGSQFGSESLTRRVKYMRRGSGEQEGPIPCHFLRPVGEGTRQRAKPIPEVCNPLQTGLDGPEGLPDRGLDLAAALDLCRFDVQVVCTSPARPHLSRSGWKA